MWTPEAANSYVKHYTTYIKPVSIITLDHYFISAIVNVSWTSMVDGMLIGKNMGIEGVPLRFRSGCHAVLCRLIDVRMHDDLGSESNVQTNAICLL